MKRNYEDPIYAEWRKRVYRRDKFKCQMPGCKNKKRLNAHHIQKWANAASLRYEVDNGITLCAWCHKFITGNEHHYQQIFQEIIREKHG